MQVAQDQELKSLPLRKLYLVVAYLCSCMLVHIPLQLVLVVFILYYAISTFSNVHKNYAHLD